MVLRSVLGILLSICMTCICSVSLHAQDSEELPDTDSARIFIPVGLELTLGQDVDTTAPLTVTLEIELAQSTSDHASGLISSGISLTATPLILAASPGITVAIGTSPQGVLVEGSRVAGLLANELHNVAIQDSDALAESTTETDPAEGMRYEFVFADVSFVVPSGWVLRDMGAEHMVFVTDPDTALEGLMVAVANVATPSTLTNEDRKTAIRRLITGGLAEYEITFLDEGRLDASDENSYATGSLFLPEYEEYGAFAAALITAEEHSIFLLYWTLSERFVDEEALDLMTQLASSLSFSAYEKSLGSEDSIGPDGSTPKMVQDELPSDAPDSSEVAFNRHMISNFDLPLPEPSDQDFDVYQIGQYDESIIAVIRNNTHDTYGTIRLEVVIRGRNGELLTILDGGVVRPGQIGPGESTFTSIDVSDFSVPEDAEFDYHVNAYLVEDGEETGDLEVAEHVRMENQIVGLLTSPGDLSRKFSSVEVFCFDESNNFLAKYRELIIPGDVLPGDSVPFRVELDGPCPNYLISASGFISRD